MHFIVCLKQVPQTTEVRIDPRTNTLIREGVESQINPFDTYALEEAVRLKERVAGDNKVTVISMGPPQVEAALREAISLGADEAVMISDRAYAGSDTWATSHTLAAGIRQLGEADLILCGMQAIDGDTAQTGPGISVHLNLPQVTYVRKIVELGRKRLVAERLTEGGHEVVRCELPALITVVKEINEPRTPSLKGKMRARKAQLRVLTQKELGLPEDRCGLSGSPTQVIRIFTPPRRPGGERWEGPAEELADKLAGALREMQII